VKFVTLQVDGLNGGVFLGENVEDGLVFLLQLIQVSHGVLLVNELRNPKWRDEAEQEKHEACKDNGMTGRRMQTSVT
jgi:hypothetical protein